MADVNMRILLSAVGGSSVTSTISSIASSLGKGGLAGTLLTVGVAAAAAAVGVGIAATKMAADYEQSQNMVQALTGSSQAQMQQYDASLKALAVDAGVAPTELSKGLYNVLSASYKGADAIKVLTLATEDSKIGMTSATITTDALTNILRSFGTQSKDITRVNGEMLQTVTLGKSTFEQYATTIVKSASASTQFHVSMETMNAAWSTMTSSGIRAAQASTDYQQSLKVMYGNIGTVTKSLHSNGIAFDENKFNAMDYGHKVQYLNTALEQANAKHVKVTGVTLQAAQAITTISKHIGDYNSNLASLSNKQAMAQKTQQAWQITQNGFNQQMSRLSASVQVLMIDLGQQLLPIITQLVTHVTPLVVAFTSWLVSGKATSQVMGVVHSVLAAIMPTLKIIGTFLVSTFAPVWQQLVSIFNSQIKPAFAQLMSSLQPLLPVLQVVGAVIGGVIVAAFVLLVSALAGVVKGFAMMLPGIMTALGGVIKFITGFIQLVIGNFQVFFGLFQGIATGNWSTFQAGVQNMKNGVINIFTGLWAMIKGSVSAFVGFFQGLISGFVSTVVGFFTHLADVLVGHSIIPDMVNAIVSWIAQLPGRVGAFIQALISVGVALFMSLASQAGQLASNLVSNVVNFFAQLPGRVGAELHAMISIATGILDMFVSTVFSIGANIVNGIANGIRSAIGNVTGAISSVTDAIGKFLPHSPAEQGELSHLNEYGPSLVTGFSQGIVSSLPVMQNAMGQLTGHVGQAMAKIADPSTVADQLSFTSAPTEIYQSIKKPVETRAVKQEEAEDKKEARRAAAEERRQAAAERRAERHQAALERRAAHHASAHHTSHHAAAHHHGGHHTSAVAAEKRLVRADIKEIKAELHIHTSNTRLDHAQIQEIVDQATRQFGLQMGEQIRAQFGSI